MPYCSIATNIKLMPPSRHIPSLGISHWIILVSNGFKPWGPLLTSINEQWTWVWWQQNVQNLMNIMIGQCPKFIQCAPWWLGIQWKNWNDWNFLWPYHHQSTIRWCILVMDITSQQFKSMWKAWNLANIINFLDFPACPPNESHWQWCFLSSFCLLA